MVSNKPSLWRKGSSKPSKKLWQRVRWTGGLLLLIYCASVIRLSSLPFAPDGDGLRQNKHNEAGFGQRKLAVVVPAHGGDLTRALASLSRWPTACYGSTLANTELVLYFAGTADDPTWTDNVLPELERTGGRCFAATRVLFGNLTAEVSYCTLHSSS